MPGGETHYNFYKASHIVFVPANIYLTFLNPAFGIGSFIGTSVLGRYLDPDLDVTLAGKQDSRMMNELSFVGYFFFGIYSMYAAAFRRNHRSFWTHFPIVSTFIRLLFIAWIPFIFYYNWITWNVYHLYFWLGVWFGLSMSDLPHYLADRIWPDKNMILSKENKRGRKPSTKSEARQDVSSQSRRKNKRNFSNKSNSRNSISSSKIRKSNKRNLDKLQAGFRYIKFSRKHRTYKE